MALTWRPISKQRLLLLLDMDLQWEKNWAEKRLSMFLFFAKVGNTMHLSRSQQFAWSLKSKLQRLSFSITLILIFLPTLPENIWLKPIKAQVLRWRKANFSDDVVGTHASLISRRRFNDITDNKLFEDPCRWANTTMPLLSKAKCRLYFFPA